MKDEYPELQECIQKHIDEPLDKFCAKCERDDREDCWMYRMATNP